MPDARPLRLEASACAPRTAVQRTLRQIDGWGEYGWRLVHGAWRLRHALVKIEPRERDADPLLTLVIAPFPLRPRDDSDACAIADWALERLRSTVLDATALRCRSIDRSPSVRANSAAFFVADQLHLRMVVRLPFTGLCCDARSFARFLNALDSFAATLQPDAALHRLRRCVAIQQALRAALDRAGLIAFLREGSRLARNGLGGPDPACRPLRVPKALRVSLDLGSLGTHVGLGIRRGITAVIGAPYHGKSTLVQAIAAGRDSHRPGDGREGIVTRSDVVVIQAEEGRLIRAQDLSPFFADLPGGNPLPNDSSCLRQDHRLRRSRSLRLRESCRFGGYAAPNSFRAGRPSTPQQPTAAHFTSGRASGATSMAASLLQALAAGSRCLLVDEDTAAGNFLWMDPDMRRLLGRDATATSLSECLPGLASAGVSVVLAVGSATPVLASADRVLHLRQFQPSDATRRARRLRRKPLPQRSSIVLPRRHLALGDVLLGDRHILHVDASEAERPLIERDGGDLRVDLRRSGWILDDDLARSACLAAAWCLRLAGKGCDLSDLEQRYHAHLQQHGVHGLDPFASTLVVVPPWHLVLAVIERLRL